MNTKHWLLSILVFTFCLSACKKNDATPPEWIIGKWNIENYTYLVKYITTDSTVGIADSVVYTRPLSDSTFDYQFFNNGTASEVSLDPNFTVSPLVSFNYQISGSLLTVSSQLYLIPGITVFSISRPLQNELTLTGSSSFTDKGSGIKYQATTKINLSKE